MVLANHSPSRLFGFGVTPTLPNPANRNICAVDPAAFALGVFFGRFAQ